MIHVYEELGDTSRRRLLSELREGPRTVSDLVLATFMKQPNVSSHLARMRVKGIVRAEKVGRQVFYSFASQEVEQVVIQALTRRDVCLGALDLSEAAKQYVQAAIQGDEAECCEIIDHALGLQMCLLEIYQDLIGPAVATIDVWRRGEKIDTAQEQMATAITDRMMARVVQKFSPSCRQDRTAVLGCGPNTWHAAGLRMTADYLHLAGWRTLFLGANVPHQCFLKVVRQNEPDLVLVGCCVGEGLSAGLSLIQELAALRGEGRKLVIGVGGPCPCDERGSFLAAGADFTCSSLKAFAKEYLPAIERSGRLKAPRFYDLPSDYVARPEEVDPCAD